MADPERASGVSDDVVAAGAVSNVAEFLKGANWPATRAELVDAARRNGADDSALEELKYLPEGRRFSNPVELFDAIGDEVRRMHAAEGAE